MGRVRGPCCDHQEGVKKGPWNTAEDMKLIAYIQKNGHDNWRALPKKAGLMRCGKSCRLRWINYLNPDIKRGNFSKEEEETIITLHKSFGNKWAKIASHLPGRTDNEIKNIWNTYIKKRLGEEPSTTRRINTKKTLKVSLSHSSSFSSMSSCVSNINSNDPDMEFSSMLEGDLCLKSSLSTSNTYVSCSKSKMAGTEDQAQSNYMSNDIGEEDPFDGLLEILDHPKEDPFEGLLEILDDPNKNFTHILEDETDQQYTTTIMLEEPNREGDWVAYLENELGLNDNNVGNDEKVIEIDLDPVATYFS